MSTSKSVRVPVSDELIKTAPREDLFAAMYHQAKRSLGDTWTQLTITLVPPMNNMDTYYVEFRARWWDANVLNRPGRRELPDAVYEGDDT